MKYLVLAVILFLVGVGLTQIEREDRLFTPVVRLRTTDGLFITLIQKASPKQNACREAIDRLVGALHTTCTTCFIESTDCATRLEGVDRALANNESVPMHTISAEGFRIAMLGPPQRVQAECEGMAAQMVRLGMKSAECAFPRGTEGAH
jgi:hypothetical protein